MAVAVLASVIMFSSYVSSSDSSKTVLGLIKRLSAQTWCAQDVIDVVAVLPLPTIACVFVDIL